MELLTLRLPVREHRGCKVSAGPRLQSQPAHQRHVVTSHHRSPPRLIYGCPPFAVRRAQDQNEHKSDAHQWKGYCSPYRRNEQTPSSGANLAHEQCQTRHPMRRWQDSQTSGACRWGYHHQSHEQIWTVKAWARGWGDQRRGRWRWWWRSSSTQAKDAALERWSRAQYQKWYITHKEESQMKQNIDSGSEHGKIANCWGRVASGTTDIVVVQLRRTD